jgi:hypothetical protein
MRNSKNLEFENFGENTEHLLEFNQLHWEWKTEILQKDLESILVKDNFEPSTIQEVKIHEQKIIL